MTIQVCTLGGPRVRVGENELLHLPSRARPCSVLTYLAVERETARETLAALLWPDSPPRKARHSLSQALSELRKDLGEDWLDAGPEALRVTSELQCDTTLFGEAVEGGRFAEALSLHAGPFLSALLPPTREFEEWAERQRTRLERLLKKAFRGLVSQHAGDDRTPEALLAARAWVETDPLDDEGNHAVIELLAASGQRAEALRHFDGFAERLQRDLELTPVDETRALVDRIRAEPVSPPAPPPSPAPSQSPIPAAPSPGELLGQTQERYDDAFHLLRPLGEGSMSIVHLAREPELQRLVALKVLRAELAQEDAALKRFEREARTLAGLQHGNIMAIYRVGRLKNGLPFIVMPYVRGVTLGDRLRGGLTLSSSQVRGILCDLASALAAAHRLGIVHRDVRPDNVMIEEETERPCLMDFGLAALLESADRHERLTRTGERIGQPGYISPELVDGKPVTAAADIYSLGVLGFALLTGEQGRRPGALPPHVLETAAERDPALTELLTTCVAERPQHRPTANQVRDRIDTLDAQPLPVRAPVEGPRDRRVWILAVTAALILLVAAIFLR